MVQANMETTASRLRHAIDGGALPQDRIEFGRQLLAHLAKPTQITVMGLPGSGKTSLVNMLIGKRLVPDLEQVAIIELAHGETARIRFTLRDGSSRDVQGTLDQIDIPEGTVRITQSLPDPTLKDTSFAEINLPTAPAAQTDLLTWAAGHSDIAIWCSPKFDPQQHAIWSSMPDALKDNSFLALTMADRLHMSGRLTAETRRFEHLYADEFLCLYPVATKQALAARQDGRVVDADLWKASGGRAFLDGIQRQIESGRMADLDHADMLLEQFRLIATAEPTPPSEPATPVAAPKAITDPGTEGLRQVAQHKTQDPVAAALQLLQHCADDMLKSCAGSSPADPEMILDRCAKTAQTLSRLMSDTLSEDPRYATMCEDISEGEQMILLFQVEHGETAASDAVTVLLQIKKDLSEASGK